MITRVILDTLLFLGVFVAPLWLVAIGAIVCLFLFENFYEIIILGIIMDGLYGLSVRFSVIPAIYTVFATVLFIMRNFLKKHLSF
jgi:hypothetical protein